MTTQIEIRPASSDDLAEITVLDGAAFGMVYTPDDLTDLAANQPSFTVATEAGRIVGVTADHRFEMTVPGGSIQVPGVTWVSVDPARRRRGILRLLMQHQLAAYEQAGEKVAILTASEGGIYSRFGYGPATEVRRTVLDRRVARFSDPVDTTDVRLIPPAEARRVLPELYRRWQRQVPGAVTRDDGWWDVSVADREAYRGGMSAKFHLAHPDGYLSYRIGEQWNDGRPAHRCAVVDYAFATEAAHAALWQVLLGLDLVGEIESSKLAADDPLPYLLTNARQLRTDAITDGIWLRPVDVAALLGARRYSVEIEVVLDVAGAGRYALSGGPDGASCTPTDRRAEVTLSRAALGSIYLGGHRLSTLARAGRATADDGRVLRRTDLAFAADRVPAHGTAF